MTSATDTSPDDRLRELMLYVAERCECDDFFGATKLNKLLFFADFLAYFHLGEAITRQEYQRLDAGPAPRRLLPVRQEMEQAGDCAIAARTHFGYPQKRLVALRDADLRDFSGEEIAIVDGVIERFRHMTASQISDFSHRFVGWETARDGETIPYETAFLTRRALTREEERWAAELSAQRAEEP